MKGATMKRLLLVILLCSGCGCTQKARQVLAPLYEQHYPFLIGVRSYENKEVADIDSLFAAILIGSGFSAGVVEEPFDDAMVDFILAIDTLSVSARKSGFILKRVELRGELLVRMFTRDGDVLREYGSKAQVETSSLNPFCSCRDYRVLCGELITSIIDEIDEDFQQDAPAIVHGEMEDDKSFASNVNLSYPTLTYFSRNGISATASISGRIPLRTVTIHVTARNGDSLFTRPLYYEGSRLLNGRREWLYGLYPGDTRLPFGERLSYELSCIDATEKRVAISRGALQTISGGMFRLKQAEVLTHGTIITAFGGLFAVMLLYSI